MIDADSVPRYDGWGPDNPWTGDEWIAWHRALVPRWGSVEADRRWAAAWLAGLSVGGGGWGTARGAGVVFDSVPVAARTINAAFHDYVAARPALYRVVYAGLGGALAAPLGGAAALGRGVASVVRDVSMLGDRAGEELRANGTLLLGLAGLLVLGGRGRRH